MDPCNVCGGTDVNLVDGFYYCVECGTQDVNVRETVVEQTIMADGTFAHATVRKFTTVVKDGVEMSSEWHKWHIFNFILAGLTDELIALGAKPSVKMKVLWIWTRYVKAFQAKDDLKSKSKLDIYDDSTLNENDNDDDDKEDSGNDDSDEESRGKKKSKSDKFSRDIKIVTKGTLLAILYVALNLDRSDIQLSHLLRFIREGRLSLYNCMKFAPKELNIRAIMNWKSFVLVDKEYSPISIRALAMTCFKRLKLGVPLVPDLRKIVKNYIQELCLPDDVKDLVFSLMHYIPIDFLDIDYITQKSLVRIPDYEGVCMTYILVALKMCFGLDGDYELRLSEEIDKINDEESYLKSYKLGMLSEPSDRLFSFKEWCQHLQFRKSILCKNYLPISRQFNSVTDDYMFMEHLEARRKTRDIKLSDDVTMDILNKIKSNEEASVIPKDEFPATLTPMSTYINVIAQQTKDPDLRLLLSEDFTQYSLKYAVKHLKLNRYLSDTENIIVGVSESGKVFNSHVIGTLNVKEGDTTMVFVRNCQNKNWLKTKPPTVDHVKKFDQNENSSDKESDHGYDSNVESSIIESEATHVTINDESVYTEDKKLETIEELGDEKSIFDDNFKDVPSSTFNEIKEEINHNVFEIDTEGHGMTDSKIELENHQEAETPIIRFNPNLFNRERMITKLIGLARTKYKIPVPKESTTREPRKRRINLINDEASSSEPKRKRTVNRSKPGETKDAVNHLLSTYYSSLQKDALNQVSQQVKSFLENVGHDHVDHDAVDNSNVDGNELNETNDIDNQTELNESVLNAEESQTDINVNDGNDVAENSQDASQLDEQNLNSETINESGQDETIEDLFTKSDPNFDEKEHDIKQLYVKLGADLNTTDITLDNIEEDPEIDKIIQRKIEEFANIEKCAVNENKIDAIADIEESSDSEDDTPLSTLKDISNIEKEKEERRKEILEPLIQDSSSIEKFNYWVRHYRSRCVERSTDMAKKFDLELNENLPISFVLVLRECASIVGCSMFSLYRNMQNIEEVLITY
ncbi:uncharacterized protein TAF1B [Epargyreus clarus]|uniref:uncharacterized protein TAF1B n=1 Tax=Epargyreus clarus TaxID=520877 RepID=UPI003C2E2F45